MTIRKLHNTYAAIIGETMFCHPDRLTAMRLASAYAFGVAYVAR